MTKNERCIPIQRLHEEFVLMPSGVLVNKKDRSSSARKGQEAGSLMSHGYRNVWIDQKQFLYHRVVFAMDNGYWSKDHVDHIDREHSNNTPSNLRDVTVAGNTRNTMRPRSTNKLGVLGVSMDGNKFHARITVDGRLKLLGNYGTLEEASEAYIAAKKQLHPEAFSATGRE